MSSKNSNIRRLGIINTASNIPYQQRSSMKLTVLIDNNTFIDQYFFGEPGLALFIEDEGTRILFDTGYSDAFIRNAQKLNLNLLDLDTLVLSHGHLDHTWGLVPLLLLFTEGMTGKSIGKKPVLVAHPQVFNSRFLDDLPEIGSLLNENELGRFFDLRLSREQVHLTDRLVYLGEIARTNDFESQSPLG